jgi:hypothetical protein
LTSTIIHLLSSCPAVRLLSRSSPLSGQRQPSITEKDITPGMIAVIQSFGSRINFHPHLHFLVTEGGTDKKGQFHKVSLFNDSLLCQFFTLEVFSLLLRKQLINKDLVQKILQWRHTGFNVHSKVRTESKEETERVGKYMIRPILSLKRLSLHEGQVLYQYGKHSGETESMDYLEFIARVTSHIPDKGQVMVRYYGLCKALHKPYYAEFKIMLCKALHKPYYAEFKIMLSYYCNYLILN